MRRRQVRMFSEPELEAAGERGAVPLIAPDVRIHKPDELTWWDWTVFLLHTAAEIEHALLAQYLYAAYSLDRGAGGQVQQWRRTIVGIAREEMAHLLTVQNLLRFIGGPLNLEREDFPFLTFLYPFPLTLEPLTKASLAKYVAAEMPADPPQPKEVIDEVVARATGATGGLAVNRVGVLYETLAGIFEDDDKLADGDLRPATATGLQATTSDWFGGPPLIVRAVGSRAEAVDALRAVGVQGEGLANPPAGAPPSHFDHFFGIYSAFPDPGTAPAPTRPVASNPNTLRDQSADADLERGRITHPTTRLWAHLCNVRYRMLLLDLTHALHLPEPMVDPGTGVTTSRGNLRDWTFEEMRLGVGGIAKLLTTRPLKQAPAAGDPANAGAPFELPYTLALPDDERDRWRLHLALLDTAGELIDRIEAADGPSDLLGDLRASDQAARAVVTAQVPP
jgi:ferritin-like protein